MFRKIMKSLITPMTLGAMIVLNTPAVKAESQDVVYLVGHINVVDLKAYFSDYATPVFPQLIAAGGEVLSATPSPEILEGTSDATWSVIVRFPSDKALKGWYNSEEYQALAPKRQALTTGPRSILYVVPAFSGFPK